jgi:hypothetical protein
MDTLRDDYDDGPVRHPMTPTQRLLLTMGYALAGVVLVAVLLVMGIVFYVVSSGGPRD